MSNPFKVIATWDDEAQVWVAESDDVPGLAAEAQTPADLIEKLEVRIPELLELNGFADFDEFSFQLGFSDILTMSHRHASSGYR